MVTVKNLTNSPVDIQAIKGVIRVPAFGEASGEFNPAALDMFKTAGWVEVSSHGKASTTTLPADSSNPVVVTTLPAKADSEAEIVKLRAEYTELIGKKPFNGWDEAELQKRIDAALES